MRKTRILIIDDEASICWGLARLCSDLSFEATTASSAEKGLDLVRQNRFDLVIMDVRLPGIDGISSIRKFKAICGDMPVIIITAFGELQSAVNAIQNGAFEYIVKPFDLEKVKSTICRAVATRNQSPSGSPHAGQENESDNNHISTVRQLQDLVARWTRQHWNENPDVPLYDSLIELVDWAILPQAFELSENQYSAAARRLGIHRTTLKKKLDEIFRNDLRS